MSRLEKLIQQFCPDGVEYRSLQQCTKKIENIKWSSTSKEYQYIDLSSVDRETNQITETQTITANTAPSRAQQIVRADDILLGTTRPMLKRYCMIDDNYDGQICSTGFCVLRANELVLPGWIYHQITSTDFFAYVEKNQKGASYPSISDANVKAYTIPVPPLEVQREIVRILDQFTELTAELAAELTAELTARKKQYEYYRDCLLVAKSDTPIYTIVELCRVNRGRVISKEYIRDNPGEYPVYSSQTENDGVLGLIKDYAYDGEYLTWTTDGANAGTVFYRKGKFNITNVCGLLDANSGLVRTRYLYYALGKVSGNYVSKGMGNPKLMSNVMGRIKIPIPPLELQDRVVSILDRFDALCNDLTSGLPAEIQARRKQYEYYRDKLLTFGRSGSNE